MNRVIHALVRRGEHAWVAECQEVAVVTLDETVTNLSEAVALHLEGEDPASFGLAPDAVLSVTMELQPASHAA